MLRLLKENMDKDLKEITKKYVKQIDNIANRKYFLKGTQI